MTRKGSPKGARWLRMQIRTALMWLVGVAALGVIAWLMLASRGRARVEGGTPPRTAFQVVAGDTAWYTERATLLAELSRREAQWAARRPAAYRFRAMWANMGSYYRGDLIAAPGRPLVICDTIGAPADRVTREFLEADIPELFQSLRTALADTTRRVFVEFDAGWGFPAHLEIGDRWITDLGYIRDVERFHATLLPQLGCAGI
jgi:hypothetical protein